MATDTLEIFLTLFDTLDEERQLIFLTALREFAKEQEPSLPVPA